MHTIILNDNEQRLAKFLAKSRYETNRANNVKDLKVGTDSNETVELEGIAGFAECCTKKGSRSRAQGWQK